MNSSNTSACAAAQASIAFARNTSMRVMGMTYVTSYEAFRLIPAQFTYACTGLRSGDRRRQRRRVDDARAQGGYVH